MVTQCISCGFKGSFGQISGAISLFKSFIPEGQPELLNRLNVDLEIGAVAAFEDLTFTTFCGGRLHLEG